MISNSDLIWAVVRLFVALPIVLIIAYLVIKYGLSRRYSVAGGNKNRMRLIEQLPLGPKAVISLVALGDKYYMLAHQDNSVQLLKELDTLPGLDKRSTGDVVELIPRPVSDIDRNGAGMEYNREAGPGYAGGGIFNDLPQKGKALYTAGRDYWKKIRSHINGGN